MKILLLSPNQINKYNWGHQLFRNDLGKHVDVIYYGKGYKNYDRKLTAPQILSNYDNVDLVMTYGLRYSLPFKDIDKIHLKTTHIVIDLFPPHPAGYEGGIKKYEPFLKKNKYNFVFYRQRCQSKYLKEIGYNSPAYWLPFSVDTKTYKKMNIPKIHDVLTSASVRVDVYPNRIKINNLVKKMGLKAVTGRVIHQRYIRAINQSKICIISTNVFNSPNMKFTEFMSCGTFVLSDEPSDMKYLGFKDGEHFVIYKNLKDLREKIRYYLKNEKEREDIAKNGMKFVRKNHNNDVRIENMLNKIHKELS